MREPCSRGQVEKETLASASKLESTRYSKHTKRHGVVRKELAKKDFKPLRKTAEDQTQPQVFDSLLR